MKVFKLAVGFAAGYVLGTRAGRERFEQIAATARKASNHPTVVQAQDKAKALLSTGTEKITAKLPHTDAERPTEVLASTTTTTTTAPVVTASPARTPRPARTTPAYPHQHSVVCRVCPA